MGLRFPPSGFTDRTAARAGVRYASWLRRFGGWAVDTLLIITINYVIAALYTVTIGGITKSYVWTLILIAVVSSTAIVYNTLCLAKLEGQTPGMRVLQIRCTPIGNRRRISIPQAFTRSIVGALFTTSITVQFVRPFLAGWAEAALAVLTVLAWFWPLVDQRRQTWWDHLAATLVLSDGGW
ncbi:MAG TPA: RDD family protein [Acidimicrobiales bacterium]|nr:RDD family protein [Acidimicrobiales bacterium]